MVCAMVTSMLADEVTLRAAERAAFGATSDQRPGLHALLPERFVELVDEALRHLRAIGKVPDARLQGVREELRVGDLEVSGGRQALRELPMRLCRVRSPRDPLGVRGDEVLEVPHGPLEAALLRRARHEADDAGHAAGAGGPGRGPGPLADDLLQQAVRGEHALLDARARRADVGALPLVEDREVQLLEVGVHVEDVLEHVVPVPRDEGELEGHLRGALRVGHLLQHLATDVCGQLRHLVGQPILQRPVV
mmetsp:Transcript_59635/g.168012  ORF Transcript_59635/g.168012 Transcript_59635/m.168012 type:complete len:250 (-) Transcript_59635:200-949(-)